jgi:hypothetical protein
VIVGLTGRAGSGKDFTFKYLEGLGYSVTRYAWADALRYEIEETISDGMYMPALWTKPYPDEVRRLLQWWGTDLRRKQDPDYWVKKMQNDLEPYRRGGPFEPHLAVVTDCRFLNEVEALRDLGGVIVRVWAAEKDRLERLGALPPSHASEVSLDNLVPDITLISRNGMVVPAAPADASRWEAVLANTVRRES